MRGTLLAVAGFEDGGSGCKTRKVVASRSRNGLQFMVSKKTGTQFYNTEAEFYNPKEQQTDPSIEPPERSPLPIA